MTKKNKNKIKNKNKNQKKIIKQHNDKATDYSVIKKTIYVYGEVLKYNNISCQVRRP